MGPWYDRVNFWWLNCLLNNDRDKGHQTVLTKLKHFVFGEPILTSQQDEERLSIPIALAVFASDALSSTAYATEEILLALIGTTYAMQANLLSLPIAAAIALLMAIVVVSYRQVILAFPGGGGTYEVSKERIGPIACQIAGAALLIDYVLTVAVSISAGVAAITSSNIPGITYEMRVPIAIIKKYAGPAKVLPDSLVPRRLMKVINTIRARAIGTRIS